MKRIKLSIICTAALMLAIPFAGCMHSDSGNATKDGMEQKIITQQDENDGCPDGQCPENKDGKNDGCPDGKCPRDGDRCPDGKCPPRRLPPPIRRRKGDNAIRMPNPIFENDNN